MTIIDKPWGFEELIEVNNNYVLKKLFMKKGRRCSLQYHNLKHETIYVLEGVLKVQVAQGDGAYEEILLSSGQSLVVTVGQVHRMEGVSDCYYLEASTPELDDVVRVSDDYGR